VLNSNGIAGKFVERRGGKQAEHGKTTKNGGKRRKSRVTSLNSSFRVPDANEQDYQLVE